MDRRGSCADLVKKGSCWDADAISSRKLNIVCEILKTCLPWFCATLYYRDSSLVVPGTFFLRCFLFALLWALTTYLYALSLKILGATEVTSLLATSVSFVYLMAWVVLHEEFVGTRVRKKQNTLCRDQQKGGP